LPFSLQELKETKYEIQDFENYIVNSLYPRIFDQNLEPSIWLQDYTTTYIERDVRQITPVKDLSLFHNFLQLCAGHIGQIINYSSFSNNLGVDVKTIKSWLSILETSYIIFLQQPFYKNFNKRVIKSPKLYFYDSGLACNLLGIKKRNELSTHYMKGGIFESFIISELLKYLYNNKLSSKLYFYRDSNQNEIDVIIESSNHLKAIEIKSGMTITSDFFKGFKNWNKLTLQLPTENYLIYGGHESQNRSIASVLSWNKLTEIFK
ncbi:MAG: DUF4143 domain-containing protein, partial [Draconibacterium sp.]|nr:DUF4143 domain-containing protein [Draconibacterium sp.]